MMHSTPRHSADRHGAGMSRTTVMKVDDTTLMQNSTHSILGGEQQDQIERVHEYGFTSVTQDATGIGDQADGPEAFMSHMGAGRSHGIAMKVGDRRYRLYKLDKGEVALHDDQGHQVHIKRDGIWASAPNSKKIVMQIMDDDKLPQDSQGQGGSKKGQIKQAGRAAAVNMTMTKDAITFNCKTFVVNASSDIKMVSGANMLVKGVSAILYATGNAFIKAAANINAKSSNNKATPDWASGADDPPISS